MMACGLSADQSSLCLDWLEPCIDWRTCQRANKTEMGTSILSVHTSNGKATCHAEDAGPALRHGWQLSSEELRSHPDLQHVLIVHEQHPQPLGCDRRLLSLVKLMQAEGRHVSLLYRHDVPESEQSPPTAQLAQELGVLAFDPSEIDSCLRPPPALYRYAGNLRQLERLMQRSWFGMILVTVWFWSDP